MLKKGLILIMLSAALFSGCKKHLNATEYVNWFKTSDDNLEQSESGVFAYELRYISPQASALMEFGNEPDSIKKYIGEYNGWTSFNLKIFAKEKSKDVLKYKTDNQEEYYQRLQYFISYINQDIKLLTKQNDTVYCAFHHYERTYNVTPFANLTVAFRGNIKEFKKLIIQMPFDKEVVAIDIKNKDYPELKL